MFKDNVSNSAFTIYIHGISLLYRYCAIRRVTKPTYQLDTAEKNMIRDLSVTWN